MFGLLKKDRSPLATSRQVDVDLLMRRNVEVIGPSHIQQTQIVRTIDAWDLDRLDGQERIHAAASQVVERFPLTVSKCELSIEPLEKLRFPSVYRPGNAEPTQADAVKAETEQGDSGKGDSGKGDSGKGDSGKGETSATIVLADQTVSDPLRTVMELANQYATHFWHRATDGRELDIHARTTNLTPICCGLGVLASDACLYDQNWNQAGWSGWSISRSGYYNAAEIGYALALLCRLRREPTPAWLPQLRLDSKVAFQKAQRYFDAQQRNGHRLLFDADRIPSTRCEPRELADWLAGDDPALAYAAALALIQLDDLPSSIADASFQATRNSDPEIPPLAVRVLGRLRVISPDVESHLQRAITRGVPAVQSAALQSAHDLGMSLSTFQKQIHRLLDHPAVDPLPIIRVIGAEGDRLHTMAPKICQMLMYALRDGEELWSKELVRCLQKLTDDAKTAIENSIRVPKLQEQALSLLNADLESE